MTLSAGLAHDWTRPGLRVSSHTVPWPQPNLLAFLRRAAGQPRFFWDTVRTTTPFAAFGSAAAMSSSGGGRFTEIQSQAEELFRVIRTSASPEVPAEAAVPRLIGGFSFRDSTPEDYGQSSGVWSQFDQAYFVLPQYVLTQFEGQAYLTVNTISPDSDPWAAQEALWNLPAPLDMSIFDPQPELVLPRDLISEETWYDLVVSATGSIHAGQLEKIVLARARELPSLANPLTALARLSGRYPDCYRFLFEPVHGHAFFGATPELLASVRGESVETMALAGSIRRGETLDADEALGRQLLDSPKERSEHQLVIQAIADRLALLAEDLSVGETGLLRLSNIQHIHTPITARKSPAVCLLDVVAALHPTPAVGGLPSGAGLDFISRAEPVSRGWYAAPVGWMDAAGSGEFIVALRSAVTDGIRTRLYAGAGIVAGSDPGREWQETELKFRPMMEAVGCLPG